MCDHVLRCDTSAWSAMINVCYFNHALCAYIGETHRFFKFMRKWRKQTPVVNPGANLPVAHWTMQGEHTGVGRMSHTSTGQSCYIHHIINEPKNSWSCGGMLDAMVSMELLLSPRVCHSADCSDSDVRCMAHAETSDTLEFLQYTHMHGCVCTTVQGIRSL